LQPSAIESAIEYILPIMKKWDISVDMVTDHRTIAPNRKTDLNPKEFSKFHEELKKHFK
jgi:N-acetyl-anhydromuramyl-L-alanine amidase AmpD